MFQKMPTGMTYKNILEKAFSKARKTKVAKSRNKQLQRIMPELTKIETVSNVVETHLQKILDRTPRLSELPVFYQKLVDIMIDVNRFRKALGSVKWAKGMTRKLMIKYKNNIKGGAPSKAHPLRREFYGRLSSVLKQINKELKFLEECRRTLKNLPTFKDRPTAVIAGFPNVGKSSLLKSITGADVEIKDYPFTTKKILVGNIDDKVQIIDTPGLLDRPIGKRNEIEKQALLALECLADRIIFVFDLSEYFDYSVQEQLELYNEIKSCFKTKTFVCINKIDISHEKEITLLKKKLKNKIFETSATENIGIPELKKEILSLAYRKYNKQLSHAAEKI